MEYWYADERSGTRYPGDPLRWRGDDGAPLTVAPLAGLTPGDVDTGVRSLWRYRAALPGDLRPVSLGEGCTPLVPRPWGDDDVRFKLEWFSPTGSFKDRGSSVLVSALAGAGVTELLEDSSGNGGSSVAAYSAAAGIAATVLAPEGTSRGEGPANPRVRREPSNWCPARATTPPPRPSAARRARPTPATTGTPSSCRARRRWRTSCGRTSASARRTRSSRSPAPAASCSAATSGSASCWRPGRSPGARVCWSPSRATAPPSTPPSTTGSRRRSPRPSPKGPPSGTRSGSPRSSRRSAGRAATPPPIEEDAIAAAARRLASLGLYAEPTSATAAAADRRLPLAGRHPARRDDRRRPHRVRVEGAPASCGS